MHWTDETRKYWKADGTYEERNISTTIQNNEFYQWRDGTWRYKEGPDYCTVHEDSLPPSIQMALLLLE